VHITKYYLCDNHIKWYKKNSRFKTFTLNYVFLFVYRVHSHSSWKRGTNRRRQEIQVHIILYFLTITNRFVLSTEHNTSYPRITSYFYDYLVRARPRVISYTILYIMLLLLLCVVGKCRKKYYVSESVGSSVLCVWVCMCNVYTQKPYTLRTPSKYMCPTLLYKSQTTPVRCIRFPTSRTRAHLYIYIRRI